MKDIRMNRGDNSGYNHIEFEEISGDNGKAVGVIYMKNRRETPLVHGFSTPSTIKWISTRAMIKLALLLSPASLGESSATEPTAMNSLVRGYRVWWPKKL